MNISNMDISFDLIQLTGEYFKVLDDSILTLATTRNMKSGASSDSDNDS